MGDWAGRGAGMSTSLKQLSWSHCMNVMCFKMKSTDDGSAICHFSWVSKSDDDDLSRLLIHDSHGIWRYQQVLLFAPLRIFQHSEHSQ